jgi:hypothetical protein
MQQLDRVQYWNVSDEERSACYPCLSHARPPFETYLRGMDVAAPVAVTFRWLCQIKVAPYSYDLLDNLGRRSPRTLTPGVDQLALGQRFMITTIVDFEPDRHITGVSTASAERLFGPIAITYQATPRGESASRIVVCMTIGASDSGSQVRRWLLGWGDLVMMRKQLLTLKHLAESTSPADLAA